MTRSHRRRKQVRRARETHDQHDEDERTPGEEGDEGAEHMSRADAEDEDESGLCAGPVGGNIVDFRTGDGATTEVVLDKGRNRGVTEGMRGYVKGADDEPLASFAIFEVGKRESRAVVSMAKDQLKDALEGSRHVVINDWKRPVEREARNLAAHVVSTEAHVDGTDISRIQLDKGTKHGVVLGMPVSVEVEGKKKTFIVDHLTRLTCTAWGYGDGEDLTSDKAVINPSYAAAGGKHRRHKSTRGGAHQHAPGH